MSKLATIIRCHFVVVHFSEGRASSSSSPTPIFAPSKESAFPQHAHQVVVPIASVVMSAPMRSAEIDAMNASIGEASAPSSNPSLSPNSCLASLASLAPAVCSNLRRTSHRLNFDL